MHPLRQVVTDPARTLAVALAFFGGLSGVAWLSGVFEQVGPETTAAVAAFAIAFTALTLACDRELRDYFRAVAARHNARIKRAAAKSPAARPAAS